MAARQTSAAFFQVDGGLPGVPLLVPKQKLEEPDR
jgi:non-ribosomal peptide synthetase component E (peptide arylation enzyme)